MSPLLARNPFGLLKPGGVAAPAPTTYGGAVLATRPIVWLGIRDTGGSVMADLSGNGRDGAYVGGGPMLNQAALVNDPGASPASASGLFSSGHYGHILNSPWMATGRQMTMACWLKRLGVSGDQFLCGPVPNNFGPGSSGYGVAISSGGTAATAYFVTDDGFGAWDGGSDVTDGNRHLFLWTYDADDPGGPVVTTWTDNANPTYYYPPMGGPIKAPTADFMAGVIGDGIDRPYTGYLQDVIICTRVMSSTERTAIWSAGS